ncbi:MAG: tetratricopeptide repeat protein [Anaerolineales bacterium]|nr:tetratricopeptide repeat protein [Anaerolineales bacterium]MCA9977936.1 tetratricopeptide repeat protein [Anaerolineales bacterium]
MGKQLLTKIIPTVDKVNWPQQPQATDLGRRTYEISIDNVDSFKEDPKVLASALRALQTCDSRPYAMAGVAYTLIAASREQDGSYAEEGLETALAWLEKAQETEPDIVDINVVEAFIYIHGGRLDDARLVLDYLQERDPYSYYLQLAEFLYWQQQHDVEQAKHWFDTAKEMSRTVPQRLRLLAQMADVYMSQGQLDEALEKYKEAVHFDEENHWLWHQISMIYWQQENYTEASHYNKRALKLKAFPEGQQLEASLKEKLGDSGVLGRLFGR